MRKILSLAVLSMLVAASSTSQAQNRGRPQRADPFAARGSAGPSAVVVEVDCEAGDRIGDALETPGDELIVKIRGMCEELVEIRRDDVTLIGTDPASDGILAGSGAQIVTIRGAANVAIENLTISASSGRVFISETSDDVRIVSCDLPGTSVLATQSSRVAMKDVEASSVRADLGARLDCLNCTASNASILEGGIVILRGTLLDPPGPTGFGIALGGIRGTFVLESSEVLGSMSVESGSLTLRNSTVSGDVTLEGHAHAELRGTGNEFPFGFIYASGFSTVWIEPGSAFIGDLLCDQAANASCENALIEGTIQGCSLCPWTEP